MGIPRRIFLAGTAAAGAAVWHRSRRDDLGEPPFGRTLGRRSLRPREGPLWSSAPEPTLRFLAIGDTGQARPDRPRVIDALDATAGQARHAFVLMLGDNFYQDGVAGAGDPHWAKHFETAFLGANLDLPFYAILGNHDYRGNIQCQVESTGRVPRWNMPSFYYRKRLAVDADTDLDLFALDTESLREGGREAESQLRWLEAALDSSDAAWKFAAGHHPIRSGGSHGDCARLARDLEPLFARYGLQMYLSGHDHDLQLLATEAGYLQLVSGGGATVRSVRWTPRSHYASASCGFAQLELRRDTLRVRFTHADGHVDFSHVIPRA